ncbi:MAG TPA: glutaredoxin family protein [Albitalea sp.]|nr:glutaredoxin family protein [Albitalea sp.]
MKKHLRTLARIAPLAALLCALPAHALYKVVGPDGKVTYTDRPELATGSKVTSLNASGTAQSDVALPLELRQAVARYPVTLYTTSNCGPCDTGRLLLRQRGIPHTEKLINTNEDADALLRLSGSRDAPTLMIGAQALRGLSADAWHSYLDSAGYPRESRLPANYQFAAATPLVERREATPEARPPVAAPEPAPAAPSPTGIKF